MTARRPGPVLIVLAVLLAGLLGWALSDVVRGAYDAHTTRQLIVERRADLLVECLELARDEAESTICLRRFADRGAAPAGSPDTTEGL